MAATQLIQVKVEPKLKKLLKEIAKYKGITLSSFIKLTLTKTARKEKRQIYTENGLTPEEENEILRISKESQEDYKKGKLNFRSGEEVIRDLHAER